MAGQSHPENSAKTPEKAVRQPGKPARWPTKSRDYSQGEAAAGEAATKVMRNLRQDGFTKRQLETLGGVGMADAREVMNIRQASQYLGVSPDTLYKYVSEERIPAFKLGNRWKFKKSILDNWMENQSLNNEVSRPRKLTRTARAAMS